MSARGVSQVGTAEAYAMDECNEQRTSISDIKRSLGSKRAKRDNGEVLGQGVQLGSGETKV